jgi:hypothetical protein
MQTEAHLLKEDVPASAKYPNLFLIDQTHKLQKLSLGFIRLPLHDCATTAQLIVNEVIIKGKIFKHDSSMPQLCAVYTSEQVVDEFEVSCHRVSL